LSRQTVLASTVVVMLALGIGATTAILTVVCEVLIKGNNAAVSNLEPRPARSALRRSARGRQVARTCNQSLTAILGIICSFAIASYRSPTRPQPSGLQSVSPVM
jgi:hypothetical protein